MLDTTTQHKLSVWDSVVSELESDLATEEAK